MGKKEIYFGRSLASRLIFDWGKKKLDKHVERTQSEYTVLLLLPFLVRNDGLPFIFRLKLDQQVYRISLTL